MLGGSAFGIANDKPYFFPGNSIDAPNLMSQLEAAGLSWQGYFQGMPYAGYRGYCFPARCNGIPDSDTQYVSKHNGIPNFTDMQTPQAFARMTPYPQLASDLSSGHVANFSYIVPDECDDMHGAPPWCVDSGPFFKTDDNYLVATGDAFVGQTVNEITGSPVWKKGNNAIVVTFDEGNFATDRIVAIVIANHGPRGLSDGTLYNHYSLLASLQDAFGFGCLLESCAATPMTPLFALGPETSTPKLPPPITPPPDGANKVSATGSPVSGRHVSLSGAEEWQLVASPSLSKLDNNLASVSAASASDAWAVGNYYSKRAPTVYRNLGEHWDGKRWTAYALPNVGPNENTLFSVSELPDGEAWGVGYYVNAEFQRQTLIERYSAGGWQVLPSPDPGAGGNILYSVKALGEDDVWAVGGEEDEDGVWHPLAVHWNGVVWTSVPAADPNGGGNLLYSVSASPSAGGDEHVYAVGQTGTGFPSEALVEHWTGTGFETLAAPVDSDESLDPFGITNSGESLTFVGARETGMHPYSTLVAAGPASGLTLIDAPSQGSGENDLFGVTEASDGSSWAVGWDIEPPGEAHRTLIEHGVAGSWSLVPSPDPGEEENGFAGVTAIPGGGLWAVGITTNSAGNPTPLIAFHP